MIHPHAVFATLQGRFIMRAIFPLPFLEATAKAIIALLSVFTGHLHKNIFLFHPTPTFQKVTDHVKTAAAIQ
jgi:hypothetical protein